MASIFPVLLQPQVLLKTSKTRHLMNIRGVINFCHVFNNNCNDNLLYSLWRTNICPQCLHIFLLSPQSSTSGLKNDQLQNRLRKLRKKMFWWSIFYVIYFSIYENGWFCFFHDLFFPTSKKKVELFFLYLFLKEERNPEKKLYPFSQIKKN